MIPHDPAPHETKADAWEQVARNLERRHPDFPLAPETAQRLADHYRAGLPLGYESTPLIDRGGTP